MIPQECRQPIASKWMRQSVDKRDTEEKIRTDPQDQVTQKAPSSSSDLFGRPSKNAEIFKKRKDPQECSGSLERLSRSDTSEKPQKANIQGVRLRTL